MIFFGLGSDTGILEILDDFYYVYKGVFNKGTSENFPIWFQSSKFVPFGSKTRFNNSSQSRARPNGPHNFPLFLMNKKVTEKIVEKIPPYPNSRYVPGFVVLYY